MTIAARAEIATPAWEDKSSVWQWLRERFGEYERANPDFDEKELAVAFVAALDDYGKLVLAEKAVSKEIWLLRQERRRSAEAAARRGGEAEPTGISERSAARLDELDEIARELESRPKPKKFVPPKGTIKCGLSSMPDWLTVDEILERKDPLDTPSRQADRDVFRARLGDRFDGWFDSAKPEDEDDYFYDKWYPGGPTKKMMHGLASKMSEMIAEASARIRLELTAELLGTEFALGDSTRVTWGEATIEQHRVRIEMQAKKAAGSVEDAAQHQAAIRMIEEAGVARLADLAGAAA